MAEADPPGGVTIAALTDKETEILRLLASGHTVKSIAVQLGRSEASINERLREARRKTHVGSSRELARLLAAQKNWDENFDLQAALPQGDTAERTPKVGPARSKGPLIMLLALPLAAAALFTATSNLGQKSATAPAALTDKSSRSPLAGTWSLDVNRIPEAERPARVTIAFQPGPGGTWRTHVEIAAPDGTVRVADSVAAADGVAVPVTGTMDFIDSATLRQPEPGTLVMTLGKQGKPVSSRVYTVSKDRKTMTETIIWAAQGLPKLETTYFNRAG
jgi:DNA-binding CsgD family transcriptional regulator